MNQALQTYGQPKMVVIKKIVQENEFVKTFFLDVSLGAKPGQFVNIWLPGVDEKPLSVAYDDGKQTLITFYAVGDMTKKLFELNEGDKVGIRGPYGTYYEWQKDETLVLMAGGYGAAPMYFVANEAIKDNCKIHFVIGARTKDLLLYLDRIEKLPNVELHIATDDGTMGRKGYNTQILEELLANGGVDRVFACGPEMMEKRIVDLSSAAGVKSWISAERYMKCGFGVCGHCCLDDSGDRVCKEGPVMSGDLLAASPEFGKYHRDKVGRKEYF
jgi:dihydroorotate dehydrogenase electron transfer subunit